MTVEERHRSSGGNALIESRIGFGKMGQGVLGIGLLDTPLRRSMFGKSLAMIARN
jgi:hypothetical protein